MGEHISIDELFDQLDREWRALPWYKKAYRSTRGWLFRTWGELRWRLRVLHNAFERARKGVGTIDLWDYNVFLASNVSYACRWMVENGHLYPGEDQGFTPELWHYHLESIAEDLEHYVQIHNQDNFASFENYAEAVRRANKALMRFASTFDHMVD